MPAYDFRCKSCEHEFTVKVPVAEKSTVCCPACSGKELTQLFTTMNYFKPVGQRFNPSGNTCGGGSSCGCGQH